MLHCITQTLTFYKQNQVSYNSFRVWELHILYRTVELWNVQLEIQGGWIIWILHPGMVKTCIIQKVRAMVMMMMTNKRIINLEKNAENLVLTLECPRNKRLIVALKTFNCNMYTNHTPCPLCPLLIHVFWASLLDCCNSHQPYMYDVQSMHT